MITIEVEQQESAIEVGEQQELDIEAQHTVEGIAPAFQIDQVSEGDTAAVQLISHGQGLYGFRFTLKPGEPGTTDPTVPAWVKAPSKPSYSASEVGALPSNTAYAGAATQGGTANRAASIPMGQLDAGSTSTVMTATVDGITELRDGVCMWLRNGVVTSAAGFTLNINDLGAKPVYGSLAAATQSTTIFNINYTMLFVYNSTRVSGGCWDVVYGYDSNTNTIGYQLRTNSLTLPMESVTYRYRLLFTSADGEAFVPANNSSSTNATSSRTVRQTPIDPHGRIVYYGATASVAAGAKPAAANLWSQYVITLGYSFNRTGAALELIVSKPVYIRCTPQSDGSAVIDPDTPFTQALPSTDDGKIYIFLGVATSATQVEIVPEHPVYAYEDGGIRLWTGYRAQSGVTAGSYGPANYNEAVIQVPRFTVDEFGRVTGAQQLSIQKISAAYTTIAAGETAATISSLYYGGAFPLVDVQCYEFVNNGKASTLTPVEFDCELTTGESLPFSGSGAGFLTASVTLPTAHSNPVLVVVQGHFYQYVK